jgi:hypothetical protein
MEINKLKPVLSEKNIGGRYRIYPIILGHRCGGYELQKEHKTLFGKKWKPVKGEMGAIRCFASEINGLVMACSELELLARHLNKITIIDFEQNNGK